MRAEGLAALHALAFTDTPRPWSAAELAALLRQPGTLLAEAPQAFALGRVAGPEAELLTLAVHPEARRRGIGRTLVARLEAMAAAAGSEEMILEVAVTNAPARALYAGLGYAEAGRRAHYYTRPTAAPVDALVLRKLLQPARSSENP